MPIFDLSAADRVRRFRFVIFWFLVAGHYDRLTPQHFHLPICPKSRCHLCLAGRSAFVGRSGTRWCCCTRSRSGRLFRQTRPTPQMLQEFFHVVQCGAPSPPAQSASWREEERLQHQSPMLISQPCGRSNTVHGEVERHSDERKTCWLCRERRHFTGTLSLLRTRRIQANGRTRPAGLLTQESGSCRRPEASKRIRSGCTAGAL